MDGPWDPANGLRCNPYRLLLDPCALAVEGAADWGPLASRTDLLDHNPDFSRNVTDSAASAPRSVVVDRSFD